MHVVSVASLLWIFYQATGLVPTACAQGTGGIIRGRNVRLCRQIMRRTLPAQTPCTCLNFDSFILAVCQYKNDVCFTFNENNYCSKPQYVGQYETTPPIFNRPTKKNIANNDVKNAVKKIANKSDFVYNITQLLQQQQQSNLTAGDATNSLVASSLQDDNSTVVVQPYTALLVTAIHDADFLPTARLPWWTYRQPISIPFTSCTAFIDLAFCNSCTLCSSNSTNDANTTTTNNNTTFRIDCSNVILVRGDGTTFSFPPFQNCIGLK